MIYQALLPQNAAPAVLLPTDKNLHDYALTVSDMRVLQSASLFFWLGDHNEQVISKLQQRFDSAQWYALAPGSDHIWLDPARQPQLIIAMADVLVKKHPQQAGLIRQRQAALIQALQQWQMQWQLQFLPLQNKAFLLGHTAFEPFAKGLGLNAALLYSSGHSHGHVQSGAQTLTGIQQRIASGEIHCAIEEPDVSFAQLAKRYPALQRFMLEPAAGSIAISPDAFIQFMQRSATLLYQCLTAE